MRPWTYIGMYTADAHPVVLSGRALPRVDGEDGVQAATLGNFMRRSMAHRRRLRESQPPRNLPHESAEAPQGRESSLKCAGS
jgi:hypothetical protein